MAITMSLSPLKSIFFIVAIFLGSVAALGVNINAIQPLAPRQSPSVTGATDVACQNYAIVANLTVVAKNSTYRAAFLRSSPMGTNSATGILDAQAPKFMALMFDGPLNQKCGNLSTVAFENAAINLTNGMVLEYPIKEAVGIAVDGPVLPILMVITIMLFGGTFISL